MSLSRPEMIAIVDEYYRRLDAKKLDELMAMLTEDCYYRIETQRVDYKSRDTAIRDMFARLYKTYEKVWHGAYRWTVDPETGVVGVQLEVVNTEPNGEAHRNHNSSFFYLRDGKISHVGIYIGGEVPKQLHAQMRPAATGKKAAAKKHLPQTRRAAKGKSKSEPKKGRSKSR